MPRWVDYTDKLGSDGCFRVDGRLSIDSIHQQAYDHAQRLRFIYSDDTRTYQILQGSSLLNAKPITKPLTIKIDRSKDEKKFQDCSNGPEGIEGTYATS